MKITYFILKIHEDFALNFWACFNVTLYAKLLSRSKTETAERCPPFPVTSHPASTVSEWRQLLFILSCLRPFLVLMAQFPLGRTIPLHSLSTVRLCPLSLGLDP